jgi:uncharacterized OB-fold protein
MDRILRKEEHVIPMEAIPKVMTRISLSPEDQAMCVERTESMYTTYWASAGEVSRFFLAVMQEKKIIGAQCPQCQMIICPPYMTRCPVCQKKDFSLVDLEVGVEMPQVGWMLATPPITVFANARFAKHSPFGRGRVMLGNSQSALPIQVFTTTGFLKPGIFRQGTQVKVVFRSQRLGFSTDYFAVPLSEVPENLRDKPGLEEGELSWRTLALAEPKRLERYVQHMPNVLTEIRKFLQEIPLSPRAQKNLTSWNRRILIKTGGGDLGLNLADQKIELVSATEIISSDLVLVVEDPRHLEEWTKGGSLINLMRQGVLATDKLQDMETIFKLDRIPRSIRRDKEEKIIKK